MARRRRPALILGALCVVSAGALAVPAPTGAALQHRDTAAPSDTVPVDSIAGLHAGALETRLDSLRVRSARFRAAITRLRVRYDVRVQRVESGLRFEVAYPPSLPAGEDTGEAVGPVARIADLARVYYPSASVAVLGTLDGVRPPCGTAPERRRAREVVERFRQRGGIDPERVRRAECARSAVTAADTATSDTATSARAETPPGATIYIEWDAPSGSP